VQASQDRQLEVSLQGSSASDLDLALTDSSGAVLTKSDSLSSSESVSYCLPAGTYYLHVYSWGDVENDYSLDVALSAASCGSSCEDDGYEDDDNRAYARSASLDFPPYQSPGNAICAWDDDWYEIYAYSGETLYATLTFSQSSGSEDLDLYLYDNWTNLSDCSEADPASCDPDNGASTDSDENLQWAISTSGSYYLVVHGWSGAENLYDLCIGLSSYDCP